MTDDDLDEVERTYGPDVEIVDFSYEPNPHPFRIGKDVFELPPEIPLGNIARVMTLARSMRSEDPEQLVENLLGFFDQVLLDEDAAVFRKRAQDKTNPIGFRQVMKLIPWVLEVYGLRPTPASSNSSTTPEDAGTTSTAGVLSGELIPADSPSTGPST